MSEDAMIRVELPVDEALKNLKNLEDQIKATQKTINEQMNPAVNNTSTRLTGLGNKVTSVGNTIKQKLGTETALAFAAMGTAALSFTKQCISSAIQSESAWTRFGALVQQSGGGTWSDMSTKVRGWARDFSNEMGYATSDTREAMTTLMEYGLTLEQTKQGMYGVAGLAARTGQTEAEAASMVTSAMNGRFTQLSKYTGLQKEEFTNADGTIDKMKLLNALYNQNSDAIAAHADTTEAQIARINNSWGTFKTSIGNALMPVVKVVADVVEQIVNWFNGLDNTWKTVIATILGLGGAVGVVIGALGLLAPVIINIGEMITGLGKLKKALTISNAVGQWDKLKNKVNGAKTTITNFASKARNIGGSIKGAVLNSWTTLKTRVNAAKTALTSYNLKAKLTSVAGTIKGAVLNGWKTLTSSINTAKTAITSFSLRQKMATIAQKAHTVATTIWSGVTKAAAGAQALLNAIMNMNPIFLVVTAIVALIAVLGYLYFNNEQVRNAVNALGNAVRGTLIAAWNALMSVIQPVIDALRILWQIISPIIDDIGALFGALMSGGDVGAAFNKLLTDIPTVFTTLQNVLPMLASMVVNGVSARFNQLIARVRSIFGNVLNSIRSRLVQAVSLAGSLAGRVRNAIITRFNLIIARVRAIFTNIVNTIRQRLANAVSQARAKAQSILTGIVSFIQQIPGKVQSEMAKIPDIIRNALSNAVGAAVSGAQNLVSRILSAMGINSPGYIQRAFASEFSSLSEHIASNIPSAIQNAVSLARGVVQAYEDNMTTLSVPVSGLNVPATALEGPQSFNIPALNRVYDVNLLGNNISQNRGNTPGSVTNTTNNSNNENRTIIIHEMNNNMEVGNLTEQQGRELFNNILDGIRPRGA